MMRHCESVVHRISWHLCRQWKNAKGYIHVGYILSLLHVYICLHKGKIEQYISWMQAQKDGQGYPVMKASLCDHSWQFMPLLYVQIWTITL